MTAFQFAVARVYGQLVSQYPENLDEDELDFMDSLRKDVDRYRELETEAQPVKPTTRSPR
jgi:hypothetical protein